MKTLCDDCRVLEFGMCPNMLILHDNGFLEAPVKKCAWYDFFENMHVEIKKSVDLKIKRGEREKK